MTISEKVKKMIRRIYRITITTVLVLLGIILLILVLIQTGPVQNWGRGKIEAYLENKLHTRVRIGHLHIGFPSRVIIKNIYLEDRQKDTLLAGGRIEVDVSMFRLLSSEVRINHLELDQITVKVKRRLPDSVFNFQFIADAFSSAPDTTKKTDTTGGFKFVIGTIQLHQIRALYDDDATGNDIAVFLGDFKTKIKTFDPALQHYSIPDIALTDISGVVRQYKPILLLQKVVDTISARNQTANPVLLDLGDIDLTRINLAYRNDAENMNADIHLGNFHTRVDSIDLGALHFRLKQIALKSTVANVRFGQIKTVKKAKPAVVKDTVAHTGAWSLDVASFTIDSTRLQYNDDNQKALRKGMDYNHLDVNHLTVHISNLHADPENYRALVAGISFDEKSGFVLKNLSTEAAYSSRGATLKNLLIQTNHSEIRNQTIIQYQSSEELSRHPGNMATNLVFDHSKIAVKDLLIFVPNLEGPLKGNQNAVLNLNGKLTGQLKDLRIPYLEIAGIGNTTIAASGQIKGLPDAKKAYYDISIARLKTSRSDLFRFIPAKSVPENIRIPANMALQGKFTGTVNRFFVNLHAVTSNGNADVRGTLDLNRKLYDLTIATRSVDLGYILKQDSLLGRFSLDATAKGSGFDPKKMNSVFHVSLLEGNVKSYRYHDMKLDANLQNGTGTVISSMDDPNISYQLHATAGFLEKYPSVKMKLELDTIDLRALHLVTDTLQMHLVADADFSSTDPDALNGQFFLHDLGVSFDSLSVHTDSVILLAQHTDTAQALRLHSEAADIDWTGQYKLTQVSESLKQFINRYYKIPVSKTDSTEPEKWQIALRMRPSPLVLALMPSLKGTDSLTGKIFFDSREKDLNLALHSDKLQINDQVIHQLNILADTRDSAIVYNIYLADAGKKGFQLYQSSVTGTLSNNKLNTTILLKDKKAKDRYRLSASLAQVNHGLRTILLPDSLMLNYEKWQVPADNFVQYDSSGLLVRNLTLARSTAESVSLNTNGETTSSPLNVAFTNFKIKTITQLAEQDSLLVDGTINGKAEIKDIFTKPLFTSDLKIDSLSLQKDTLGNLTVKVSNEDMNTLIAHIALQGHDNDIQIDGKYIANQETVDMDIKLTQLNLATFKGISYAQARDMKGYLTGKLHASGSLNAPLLKGSLSFKDAEITPVITGEPLKLSNDVINFDEGGFDFAMFTMVDSAGNKATLDGNVFTKDFKDYKFDLTFSAQNFRAVNAPKAPDRMFYGKLNVNTDIDVTGDLELPKIDATIRANKNTDFYVVLPSSDPEVEGRNGVVVFVNKKRNVDSSQLKRFLDSLSLNARLKGMDVSATIETDTSAQFTLIIDERNGDALSIRGRAELTGGVDKSGKISLTGNYLLVNGAYNLTLSVLHRRFEIQRGSVITWTGDPRTANIDITAIYTVNTPPIDLVQDQLSSSATDLSRYKARLPFQVKLMMSGELLKPIIKFDISLPSNLLALWPEVDTKLQQMRTDEAEENKQTFALLLLGRFIQQNPFQSSGASTNAESIARQSASNLLADQLNQIAGSLVKGVEVNFDLNSGQDFSSGQAVNQTDLNVKISKSLFDDRIRVTVGSDFQLEETNPGQNATNLAGDVSVDYKLSKDGRYMVRVYRNDQYQTVVQGQVVETGLSFILTYDYNKFRELFRKPKETTMPARTHHNTTQQAKPSTSNPPDK